MNYDNSYSHSLNLWSRNEGKIKSYESCRDLRAWSHDTERRDHYLREWIKCDMPISVITSSTLIYIIKKMTCGSKTMVTPRCHVNCKSKALLESIRNSCHVMKKFLRNDQAFDKYFEDEELESSHWPCERCLDALKSIKMFWKIIIEKVLNIKIPKNHQFNRSNSFCADDVRSVAKIWQTDMVRQTMFVKNSKPIFGSSHIEPNRIDSTNSINSIYKFKKIMISKFTKATDTEGLSNCYLITKLNAPSSYNKKVSCQILTNLATIDIACSCSDLNDESITYKVNFNCLREKLHIKDNEIERLKKKNNYLKKELQTLYKNSWCEPYFYIPDDVGPSTKDARGKILKPYEAYDLEADIITNRTKPIDSEMIITMKNCKNESYRHISLLQVLHKTNAPDLSDLNLKTNCSHKEDPIALLEKVQNKFGAIVSRELSRASHRSCCESTFDVDASYHKVNGCKPEPSCSTMTVSSCNSNCSTCRLIRET